MLVQAIEENNLQNAVNIFASQEFPKDWRVKNDMTTLMVAAS